MRIPLVLAFAVLQALFLFGCAAAEESQTPGSELTPAIAAHPADTAAACYDGLEERLLAADFIHVVFDIKSAGALESHLEGELRIDGDEVHLDAKGPFGSQPLDIALRADATTLTLKNAAGLERSGPRPAELKEALLLGLTRMGLLHNLALLSSGAPPEGSRGGFRRFATTFCFEDKEVTEGEVGRLIDFAIFVRGEKAADAHLLLDTALLPRTRKQTVDFPAGQMRVTESYRQFQLLKPETEDESAVEL